MFKIKDFSTAEKFLLSSDLNAIFYCLNHFGKKKNRFGMSKK